MNANNIMDTALAIFSNSAFPYIYTVNKLESSTLIKTDNFLFFNKNNAGLIHGEDKRNLMGTVSKLNCVNNYLCISAKFLMRSSHLCVIMINDK